MLLTLLLSCSRFEFEPPEGTDPTTTDADPPGVDTVDTFVVDEPRPTPWACYGRATVDSDGDGREDYAQYESYDPKRRDLMLHQERDIWDDGEPEWRLENVYDASGHHLREAEDDDVDGVFDEVTTWAYDPAGAVIEEAFDVDGDGDDDEVWIWTRDGDGNIVVEEVDADGDGVVDERREWVWVDALVQSMLEDLDADGVIDLTYVYVYDADRLVRIEGDAGDGPPLEYLSEYEWPGPYDSYIRRTDLDGDGVIDEHVEVGLDERGLLAFQHMDLDGNGVFEARWDDVVYDDDRRFESGVLTIDPAPGVVEADIWTYTYTYANPTGPWYLLRQVEHRSEPGGPVGSMFLATYDWICP